MNPCNKCGGTANAVTEVVGISVEGWLECGCRGCKRGTKRRDYTLDRDIGFEDNVARWAILDAKAKAEWQEMNPTTGREMVRKALGYTRNSKV